MDPSELVAALDGQLSARHPAVDGRARLAHVQRLPPRRPELCELPADLPAPLPQRLELLGIDRLYGHQAEALALIRQGRHVVVATGTASGKSLCYQLPLAERLVRDDRATALYLAPTKALAHDQLRALRALRLPQVRAAAYDGDTPRGERDAVRRTANVVLTNPDMLHVGILPAHQRWGDFLHRLELVIVDECHTARGVFGAHVAAILRRLRRVCAHYASGAGQGPVFALTSATIGNPAEHAANLTGCEVTAVTRDGSPRPPITVALWEPALTDAAAGARRSTLAEAADLLAGVVTHGSAALVFAKSRKGAELVALAARRALGPAGLDEAVAAYRGGHLPAERRAVEQGLMDGSLQGVAATDALELGVDIGALDAVIIAGWPGSAASLWQQAGRAGRRDRAALVTFVAADDPLDHWLLAHPDRLLGAALESAIADVSNPHVLRPHLRCAAFELPLAADETAFGTDISGLVADEVAAGGLRERAGRHYVAGRDSPAGAVSIRSSGGQPFQIVEEATGALIGDVDEARAYRSVHPGAVYLHQGATYRISRLDLDDRVALAAPYSGEEYTRPRVDTDITVTAPPRTTGWGRCQLAFGTVQVATAVLAYERRHLLTERSLGLVGLDLPTVQLTTRALWLTVPETVLTEADLDPQRVPGTVHAAEHAAIGMLPLLAMCDRWDVGGVSTAWHPDTGAATIFIHDGYPGGAGIAERCYDGDETLWQLTLDAVAACQCAHGCPSCVQSPKCGNGNEPLDKPGAVRLLAAVLAERAAADPAARHRARL